MKQFTRSLEPSREAQRRRLWAEARSIAMLACEALAEGQLIQARQLADRALDAQRQGDLL